MGKMEESGGRWGKKSESMSGRSEECDGAKVELRTNLTLKRAGTFGALTDAAHNNTVHSRH
jgi:hypothetical protein